MGAEEPVHRKKKRKMGKKYEVIFERLVYKVMEKQEEMHKQLLETIERKERERILREEAWRKQEMDRIRREEEYRAQETAHNLAIISFIQNALGCEIKVSQPPVPKIKVEEKGKSLVKTCDYSNKRWPDAEIQALITIRAVLEHKFRVSGSKGSIWEEISAGMQTMGYNRSAKKCKEKWENMNKYFKRSMVSGKKRSDNGKTCQYFHELEMLYRNGLVNQGHSSNEKTNGNESELENE